MDKKLLEAKLKAFGIPVYNNQIKKSDALKVLSKLKVTADDWQEGNLIDLGIAPYSASDQAHPVNYKEVHIMMVVGVDENDRSYRYDIFKGTDIIGSDNGFKSADEAMRAAERELRV